MNLHATSAATAFDAAESGVPEHGILAEIAAGLGADSDIGAVLQRFLEPIVRLAGAQGGAVRVLSDSGQTLQIVSAIGVPAGVSEHEQAVDRHCGHCGSAADEQALVWTSDLQACARHSPGGFFGEGCQRLLAVPLSHRGRTLGVYNLFFDAAAEKPPAANLALLKSIGELLGLALNNARLEQEQLRAKLRQERQWVAAEVHDAIAQSLAFVKMRMPLLHDAMLAHDDERALQYYADMRGAVTQAHASLRGLLTHLRTPMDPLGLAHALEASVARFRQTSGARIDFVNEVPGLRLGDDQQSNVFHIVQEALSNIARHAAASRVSLHIARAADNGDIEVLVEDDGVGLSGDATAQGGHYGLEIMSERARRIGGSLTIGPGAHGGTQVRLRFPIDAHAHAAPAAVDEVHG